MHVEQGDPRSGRGETTSVTLLARLRQQPADVEAWREFVDRYGPRIHAHCLAVSLQPADAQDVAQSVLIRLFEKLPEFRYDPSRSFRAWLRTVTRNCVSDFLAERKRSAGGGDSAVLRILDNLEAREDLARHIEAEFGHDIVEEAMSRVRVAVPAQQWEAFRLTAIEGLSGAEAGARLGMLVATVYTARSKVQKRIREEIRRLEADPEAR